MIFCHYYEMLPLAIDLFCGIGGWTDGLLAEGWDVIGFDIERHEYGEHRYPAQLIIQDVLTLHGSQFRNADLIVASPPCQFFSYCAMPWTRAKALAAEVEADITRLEKELALFKACFRIQREASEAAERKIPLIIENVKGAQRWIGRARWAYGSFYLWGDVPALMPFTYRGAKVPGLNWSRYGQPDYKGEAFNTHAERRMKEGIKNTGGSWFAVANNTTSGKGQNPDGRKVPGGGSNGWLGENDHPLRQHTKGHLAREAASAMIAKIPIALSRHIAAVFRP